MRTILVLLFLTFLNLTFSKLGSLSLYHVAGTTFLNLPKLSNRASVTVYFKNDPKIQGLDYKLKEALYEDRTQNIISSGDARIFKNTHLGDVYLHETSLTTGFFQAPNGHRHQQGWILTKEQYLTPEQENGDEEVLKKVVKILEDLPTTFYSVIVNVEIPKNITLIRDVIINVYRPENRKHIVMENNFRDSGAISPVLLRKMMQTTNGQFVYNPSFDEFFDDYMIRQTAEFLIKEKAWTAPIKEVSQELYNRLDDLQYPHYGVDLIQWFSYYKPEHFLCKKFLKENPPSPSIQFHEFSTNVSESLRRGVGLVKATELYGPFISDQAVSQITSVGIDLIRKIRKKLIYGEAVIVKYIAWDPESCPHIHRRTIQKLQKTYKKDNVIFGFMSPQFHGYSPLVIPGNSIVWHSSPMHRFNIIGKYNPSLVNFNVAQFLENKFFEHLFYETYCPAYFPVTKHLRDILPPGTDLKNIPVDLFTSSANKAFPDGWIIKGVWEMDGSHEIINHKIQGHRLLDDMYKSQFLDWASKHKYQNEGYGCDPHQGLNSILRTSRHVIAHKLHNYLHNGNDVIIQKWTPTYREFKLECYGTVCPKDLITEYEEQRNDTSAVSKGIRNNSLFAFQQCLANIPDKIRGMALSVDIGVIRDFATPVIYETNPGGKSVYILQDSETVKKHNNFLQSYPELYSSSKKVQKGLSPEDQIKYIINLIHHWKINPIEYEHRFILLPDRIIDWEHKSLIQMDYARFNSNKEPKVAHEAASIGQRYKAVRKSLERIAGYTITVGNFTNILTFTTKLSYMKEGINYNKLRHRIVQKLRRMRGEYLTYFIKELKKVSVKAKSYFEPAKFILKNIDVLLGFQTLNFEHSALRSEVIHIFSKLTDQEVKDLFPHLNEVSFINLVKNLTKDKKSIEKFDDFIYNFSSDLYSFHGLYRFGIRLRGPSVSKTISSWIHRLRALYPEKVFFESTLKGVLTLLFVLSDNSLFYIEPTEYQKEYEFLMRAMNDDHLAKNPYLLGKAINGLIIIRADETFAVTELINQVRVYLLETKSKSGLWLKGGKESLTATLGAIRGLIEHNYMMHEPRKFGHLVKQQFYTKRLQELGFSRKVITNAIPLKDEL